MASLDFFAGPADAEDVLAFAFDDLGCQAYEAASSYDHSARQFGSADEARAAFPHGLVADALEAAVRISLWAPSTGGGPVTNRIALKVKGHSFREMVVGWGVIRLNFGVLDPEQRTLESSCFLHNSKKRALAWEDTSRDVLGPVAAWDWEELERVSRKLRYHLRQRLAVTKVGSAPVLSEAQTLRQEGYELRRF